MARAVATLAVVLCVLPWAALAATTFIADSRIRNPNLTPALGRGFSLTTYGVLSTCLDFSETTEPTYNYDYDLMEVNSEGKSKSTAEGSFKASMSWGFIKATVSGSMKSSKESHTKKHHIIIKMKMERYYSSVDDTTAVLTKDAQELLDKGDTVGFFQACGSGYIRSIRRTAEVTAVFGLESTTTTEAAEFAAKLKISIFGRGGGSGSFSSKSESFSSEMKMTINIKAFGLGLNLDGADSLVARSLEDFDKAIKFAFKSMQNHEVGMIRGIEVVPWMDNLQFQNNVNFIDMAFVGDEQKTDADGNGVVDAENKAVMKDVPVSALEVKSITTLNGEFLQMLDSLYRENVYLLASMRRCVGELDLLIQAGYENHFLVDHTGFDMKKFEEGSGITVADVWTAVNHETLMERFKQTESYISSFYGPCTKAVMEHSDGGRMVRYWFDDSIKGKCHPQCLRPNYEFTATDGETAADGSGVTIPCKVTPPKVVGKGDAAITALTLEGVVERFCMPEIDTLNPPIAKAKEGG